ncbi:MAG: class I adenylate-forming enzyme family protein [Endozoicomonas sp.]
MPFLSQLIGHPADRIAIIDSEGEHSYGALIHRARLLASTLREHTEPGQTVIAFLAERDASSLVALLGIWLADAVAVALDPLMAIPEWEWRIRELGATILVYAPVRESEARYLASLSGIQRVCTVRHHNELTPLKFSNLQQNALVLYTCEEGHSPRGVIHSFSSLDAQVKTLCHAWDWQPRDRILNILPLSHIYGLVEGLLCPMAAGASTEILPSFKTEQIWEHLASGGITLLSAVPAIYQYLMDNWDRAGESDQQRWQKGARKLRLVSVNISSLQSRNQNTLYERWRRLIGRGFQVNYGMVETGVIFCQQPHSQQRQNYQGQPLPGVSIRLADEEGNEVTTGSMGELLVRSPQMFSGYFGRQDLIRNAFLHGWFRTFDLAVSTDGGYQLLGRCNQNKTTDEGDLVAAREVETLLDTHSGIRECAVLSLPCSHQSEAVCACIVPVSPDLNTTKVRQWLHNRLATRKMPTRIEVMPRLPRTAKGAIDRQCLQRELGACRT